MHNYYEINVALMQAARGAPTMAILIKDADEIDEMLAQLSRTLNDYVYLANNKCA